MSDDVTITMRKDKLITLHSLLQLGILQYRGEHKEYAQTLADEFKEQIGE